MTARRTFIVWGYRPVNPRANEFIKMCDLGEGMFHKFAERTEIAIREDCTPEMLAGHPGAIVAAYEKLGHRNVQVYEVTRWPK